MMQNKLKVTGTFRLTCTASLVNLFSKGSKTLSVWIGFHVQYTCNTDRGKSGRAEWLFTWTANIQLLVLKVVNSNSSYNFQDK